MILDFDEMLDYAKRGVPIYRNADNEVVKSGKVSVLDWKMTRRSTGLIYSLRCSSVSGIRGSWTVLVEIQNNGSVKVGCNNIEDLYFGFRYIRTSLGVCFQWLENRFPKKMNPELHGLLNHTAIAAMEWLNRNQRQVIDKYLEGKR